MRAEVLQFNLIDFQVNIHCLRWLLESSTDIVEARTNIAGMRVDLQVYLPAMSLER